MKQLSTVQQKVFNKLRDHQRKSGHLPDLSGFARDLGMHYVSLKQHLTALSKKGYIVFESRGRGRSPFIALAAETTGIPVIGAIPAGPLTEAVQEAEGYLPLSGFYEGHFALRVMGDSMADFVQDGDIVLFKNQNSFDYNGQMCAVRVADDDATLKYVDKVSKDECILRPHNLEYEPIHVATQDIKIDGVYLGLLRGELIHALMDDRQTN